jgi:hypothetical protein
MPLGREISIEDDIFSLICAPSVSGPAVKAALPIHRAKDGEQEHDGHFLSAGSRYSDDGFYSLFVIRHSSFLLPERMPCLRIIAWKLGRAIPTS